MSSGWAEVDKPVTYYIKYLQFESFNWYILR